MKTLSVISLSIILAACGGEGGSSDDLGSKNNSVIMPPDIGIVSGYELVEEECGANLALDFDELSINDSSKNIKAQPSGNASRVNVSGSSHDICIGGSISQLNIVGSSHNIYINGSIGQLNIDSSSVEIYVFGGIGAANLEGSSNDIYTQEIATYTDSGTNNDIMNISNAKL
jgi:hypothetical protein